MLQNLMEYRDSGRGNMNVAKLQLLLLQVYVFVFLQQTKLFL